MQRGLQHLFFFSAPLSLARLWVWICRPALRGASLALLGWGWGFGVAGAQMLGPAAAVAPAPQSAQQWLQRIQEAPRRHSYVGELVVSAAGRRITTLIEHRLLAEGAYVDRVEALRATPRISYRQPGEVLTLWPLQRQAVREQREAIPSFPRLLQGWAHREGAAYSVQPGGRERLLGHWTQRITFSPRDDRRYGYILWAEERSGLPLKMQIVDAQGQVLEQSVFARIEFDPPEQRLSSRESLAGYQIRQAQLQRSQPEQEGWLLQRPVHGFVAVDGYRRILNEADGQATLQWIFSDGLASVSLFVQPFDRQQHRQPAELARGATRVLMRRIGDWWLTAVGEVPGPTLQAFADGLQRRP
jgi:sigma-E factor negative regulatory protein RseB